MYRVEELEIKCRLYRQATIALTLVLAFAIAGLIALSARGPKRYLVVLDDFAAPRHIEPLEGLEQTEKRFLVAELRRAITSLRSVSRDSILNHLRLTEGLEVLTSNVRRDVLRDLREKKLPRQRQVEVLSIHELEEAGRYLVRWQETTFNNLAEKGTPELWEAYLTTGFLSDLDENQILGNPLGLVITHLSWTRLGSDDMEIQS
jgi:type IV secretory pathway TrbF-like protein